MANELKIRVVFDSGEAKVNSEKLAGGIKAVEGSLKDLENQWKKLDQIARSQYAVGSPQQVQAVANASMAYKRYQEAVAQTSTVVAQNTRASANAATTLQALNYTVRDSPYFFRDFSLGILAVGNNLNPLIDGFIRMKQETGSYGNALKSLGQSLTGASGVIFTFSLLVTVLQAVTFAMAKNKAESKETKKSYEDLTDALQYYKATLQEAEKMEQDILKVRYESELQGITQKMSEFQAQKGDIELTKARQYPEFQRLEARQAELKAIIGTTAPEINKYAQKITELASLAEVYQGKQLQTILTLAGVNKNILASTISSLEKEFDRTDRLDKKYIQLEQTIIRLKDAKKALFPDSFREGNTKERPLAPDIFDIKRRDYDEFEKVVIDSIERQEDAFLESELERYKTQQEYDKKIQEWRTKAIEDEYERSIQSIKDKYEFEKKEILKRKELEAMTSEQAEEALGALGGWAKGETEKVEKKKKTEEYKKALQEAKRELSQIQSTAISVGDSLYQAFLHGKNGVDALLISLGEAILKMTILMALEKLLLPNLIASFLPIPSVGSAPDLLPSIPKPRPSMQSSTQSVTSRLDAMNLNMMNNQPVVYIYADTDAVKFTRQKTNPAQDRLSKGNIINVV